jgi:hypothetical protein
VQAAGALIRASQTAPRWGVPGATPLGVGTLAPPAESPMTAASHGVPPRGTVAPAGGTLRRCDVAAMLVREPDPVDWLVDGVVARAG